MINMKWISYPAIRVRGRASVTPLWTEADPRQDNLIMVFIHAQSDESEKNPDLC